MSKQITIEQIRERLAAGEITAIEAPGIIRALCDGVAELEADALKLRARVAELEPERAAMKASEVTPTTTARTATPAGSGRTHRSRVSAERAATMRIPTTT